MKTYIVYKYRNIYNNKVYIGQTCRSLSNRAGKNGAGYQGCTYFYHAIQKYGWQNFEATILAQGLSKEQANEQEKYYIDLYNARNPNLGYNLLEGGQGDRQYHSKTPEETRKKMSENMIEKWKDPAYKQHFSTCMKEFYKDEANTEKIVQMQNKKKGVNHPRSKAVICIETGETFSCLREAAIWCGMKPESAVNIGAQIAGKRLSAGTHPVTKEPLHWRFADGETQTPKASIRGRKVKNLDTGELFDSMTQASQLVGISTSTIKKSCDSHGIIGVRGYKSKYTIPTHWVFVE